MTTDAGLNVRPTAPNFNGTYPELVLIEWVDATNIAQWTDLDEIPAWAADGGFICRNVGYLVHEDDRCIVLAARVALDAEPQQAGLFERIPTGIILNRWTLSPPSSPDGRELTEPDRVTLGQEAPL